MNDPIQLQIILFDYTALFFCKLETYFIYRCLSENANVCFSLLAAGDVWRCGLVPEADIVTAWKFLSERKELMSLRWFTLQCQF